MREGGRAQGAVKNGLQQSKAQQGPQETDQPMQMVMDAEVGLSVEHWRMGWEAVGLWPAVNHFCAQGKMVVPQHVCIARHNTPLFATSSLQIITQPPSARWNACLRRVVQQAHNGNPKRAVGGSNEE